MKELSKTRKVLKIGCGQDISLVEEETVSPKSEKPGAVFYLAQASEIGFSIALPISLGALFGVWLDKRFSTHPKLTLSFLFVGIFLGFTNLFMVVKYFSKKRKI